MVREGAPAQPHCEGVREMDAEPTSAVPEEGKVWEALRAVIDPEIGLNIVDLGLIYDLGITSEGTVRIEMTLTTPGCPLHTAIHDAIHGVLAPIPGVRSVDLDLVWLPPWTPEMITPAGRRSLGWPEED